MVDHLSELLTNTKLHCPIDELELLRNNYIQLFYYKNNNIDIPDDFYKIIHEQTHKYYKLINLNNSYTPNSITNYKINIVKILFSGFVKETDHIRQIDFIYAIFNNLLIIVDN